MSRDITFCGNPEKPLKKCKTCKRNTENYNEELTSIYMSYTLPEINGNTCNIYEKRGK